MAYDPRHTIDMTPDGGFRAPKRTPISNRIIAYAVALAVLAGAVAVAAFALWVALALIPVVFVAVLVVVVMVRIKQWRAKRAAGSFSSQRDITRL